MKLYEASSKDLFGKSVGESNHIHIGQRTRSAAAQEAEHWRVEALSQGAGKYLRQVGRRCRALCKPPNQQTNQISLWLSHPLWIFSTLESHCALYNTNSPWKPRLRHAWGTV